MQSEKKVQARGLEAEKKPLELASAGASVTTETFPLRHEGR